MRGDLEPFSKVENLKLKTGFSSKLAYVNVVVLVAVALRWLAMKQLEVKSEKHYSLLKPRQQNTANITSTNNKAEKGRVRMKKREIQAIETMVRE